MARARARARGFELGDLVKVRGRRPEVAKAYTEHRGVVVAGATEEDDR